MRGAWGQARRETGAETDTPGCRKRPPCPASLPGAPRHVRPAAPWAGAGAHLRSSHRLLGPGGATLDTHVLKSCTSDPQRCSSGCRRAWAADAAACLPVTREGAHSAPPPPQGAPEKSLRKPAPSAREGAQGPVPPLAEGLAPGTGVQAAGPAV